VADPWTDRAGRRSGELRYLRHGVPIRTQFARPLARLIEAMRPVRFRWPWYPATPRPERRVVHGADHLADLVVGLALPAQPAGAASARAGSAARAARGAAARPLAYVPGSMGQARLEQVLLALFIVVPFLAVLAAVPVMWGWGLGWHDVVIAVVMYAVSGHGIT